MQKVVVSALALLNAATVFGASRPQDEARVTRVVRQVELVEQDQSKPKPAAVNDRVSEDTAVRTGQESRGELTFKDLTITRLGENTIFTFNKGGRGVHLNAGSILLHVPKNSGGAHMSTDALSVAISGTTVILKAKRDGRSTLTALEDGARVSLIKNPKESVYVREGQFLDVPAGATKMPKPVNIDLNVAMKTPLITDFPPLPKGNLAKSGTGKPTPRSKTGGGSSGSSGTSGGGSGPIVGPGQSGPGPVVVDPNRPPKPKKPKKPRPTPTPKPDGTPRGGGGKGGANNDGVGNTGTVGPRGGGGKTPTGPNKPTKRPRPKPKASPSPSPQIP